MTLRFFNFFFFFLVSFLFSESYKDFQHVTLVFEDNVIVTEVRRSSLAKQKGLMFRRYLLEGEGMLFVNDRLQIDTFWMKNTFIPLDLLFLDENFRVVDFLEYALPLDETQLRAKHPFCYVLEVPAGYLSMNHIVRGTVFVVDDFVEN
ncbi:MAG: DUF192 domain-containing protein [bacterium]